MTEEEIQGYLHIQKHMVDPDFRKRVFAELPFSIKSLIDQYKDVSPEEFKKQYFGEFPIEPPPEDQVGIRTYWDEQDGRMKRVRVTRNEFYK